MRLLLFPLALCSFVALSSLEWQPADYRADILAADYQRYLNAIGLADDSIPIHHLRIDRVDTGSPAALAGMLSGDILIAWNNLPLVDGADLRALQAIGARDGSRSAKCTVLRNGEFLKLNIPVTKPRCKGGFHHSGTDPWEIRRRARLVPALVQLLETHGIEIPAADYPWFHTVPPYLVQSLRSSLQQSPDLAQRFRGFVSWYPLLPAQRWQEAAQAMQEQPVFFEGLPQAWQTWLLYLEAVCQLDHNASRQFGEWYHVRHYPWPVQIHPIGEPVTDLPYLTEGLALSRAAGTGNPRFAQSDFPNWENSDHGGRRYLRQLALGLVFWNHGGWPYRSYLVWDDKRRQKTRKELEGLKGEPRIDEELRLWGLACCDIIDGNPASGITLVDRWRQSCPYTASRAADTLINAAAFRGKWEAWERLRSHCAENGVLIRLADETFRRRLLAPGFLPRQDIRLIDGHLPQDLLVKMWWAALNEQYGVASNELWLNASKKALNEVAWDFATTKGFVAPGALKTYRRELLRALALQAPNFIVDTVAALDMALEDTHAARTWQQVAIRNASDDQRDDYLGHLQHYLLQQPLPRTGDAWDRISVPGVHAGKLRDKWHGPAEFDRNDWQCKGWMLNGQAVGPWTFSRDNMVRVEGHFHRGWMIGPWRMWDEEGRLLAEGLIFQDERYRQPMRIGWWRVHDPASDRHAVGLYLRDKPSRQWRLVDPSSDTNGGEGWQDWQSFASNPEYVEWLPRILVDLPTIPTAAPPGVPEPGTENDAKADNPAIEF